MEQSGTQGGAGVPWQLLGHRCPKVPFPCPWGYLFILTPLAPSGIFLLPDPGEVPGEPAWLFCSPLVLRCAPSAPSSTGRRKKRRRRRKKKKKRRRRRRQPLAVEDPSSPAGFARYPDAKRRGPHASPRRRRMGEAGLCPGRGGWKDSVSHRRCLHRARMGHGRFCGIAEDFHNADESQNVVRG